MFTVLSLIMAARVISGEFSRGGHCSKDIVGVLDSSGLDKSWRMGVGVDGEEAVGLIETILHGIECFGILGIGRETRHGSKWNGNSGLSLTKEERREDVRQQVTNYRIELMSFTEGPLILFSAGYFASPSLRR